MNLRSINVEGRKSRGPKHVSEQADNLAPLVLAHNLQAHLAIFSFGSLVCELLFIIATELS